MTASTLFALVFGEIAHKIKGGEDPFTFAETITLGCELDEPGRPSTLIFAKDRRVFRLTVEEVKFPRRSWAPHKRRWPTVFPKE